MTTDASGNVYAADAMAKTIHVFGATGDFIRTIGRDGRGPGEFEYPIAIRVSEASLFVYDPLLGRVTTFLLDGTLREMNHPPPEVRIGQVWEGDFTADGRLLKLTYSNYQASLMQELSDRRQATLRGVVAIQRLDDENVWTTLREVPGPEVFVDLDRWGIQDVPYGSRPKWAADQAGGFWYTDSREYALEYHADGQLRCRIVVDWPAHPVSDDERRAFFSAEEAVNEQESSRLRAARRSITLPENKPVITRIASAENGDVWVRPSTAGDKANKVEWHVFTPLGEPAAVVWLPDSFEPHVIRGTAVWGIEKDEDDVQFLMLFRLDDDWPRP